MALEEINIEENRNAPRHARAAMKRFVRGTFGPNWVVGVGAFAVIGGVVALEGLIYKDDNYLTAGLVLGGLGVVHGMACVAYKVMTNRNYNHGGSGDN